MAKIAASLSNPVNAVHKDIVVLYPYRLCETQGGDLAHTVGRLAFKPGRPMLVEHVGGLYLEHDLQGRVLTPGYGDSYRIAHVWDEGETERRGRSFARNF